MCRVAWGGMELLMPKFAKIKYDKKVIIYTHMDLKIYSYTFIHMYTPTHIYKK